MQRLHAKTVEQGQLAPDQSRTRREPRRSASLLLQQTMSTETASTASPLDAYLDLPGTPRAGWTLRAALLGGAALALVSGCRSDPAVDHPCGPHSDGPCLLLLGSWDRRMPQGRGNHRKSWRLIDTAGKQYRYRAQSEALDLVQGAMEDWLVSAQETAEILLASQEFPDRVPMRDVRRVLGLLVQAKDGEVEEFGGPCDAGILRDVHGFVFDSRAQAQQSVHLQASGCEFLYEQNTSPAGLEVSQWSNELWHQRHPQWLR